MLFYDEALEQLKDGLGNRKGWTCNSITGGVEYLHDDSETTLRLFGSGDVVVANPRILEKEVLRYDGALRRQESMGEVIEFADALATRNKAVLLRWVGPRGLKP